MRWRLIRRRIAHTKPRGVVRGVMPWPVRWALIALLCGFFGAFGMWAFEAGKSVTGLGRRAGEEVIRLRSEIEQVRQERDKAQSIANTADSLLKTEKATQDMLAAQVRDLESQNLALKADLSFFERLLPSGTVAEDVSVRGLQVLVSEPGQLRYQLLVMQAGRARPEFSGRFDLLLTGTLDGRPWTSAMPGGARLLHFKQYQRVEGEFPVPLEVVLKTVQVRVMDAAGVQRTSQTVKL